MRTTGDTTGATSDNRQPPLEQRDDRYWSLQYRLSSVAPVSVAPVSSICRSWLRCLLSLHQYWLCRPVAPVSSIYCRLWLQYLSCVSPVPISVACGSSLSVVHGSGSSCGSLVAPAPVSPVARSWLR